MAEGKLESDTGLGPVCLGEDRDGSGKQPHQGTRVVEQDPTGAGERALLGFKPYPGHAWWKADFSAVPGTVLGGK